MIILVLLCIKVVSFIGTHVHDLAIFIIIYILDHAMCTHNIGLVDDGDMLTAICTSYKHGIFISCNKINITLYKNIARFFFVMKFLKSN